MASELSTSSAAHTDEASSPSGWSLVRPVLRQRKTAMLRLLLWSLLAVVPIMASGQLVMVALDRGFLRGDATFAVALLGAYALLVIVGAFANRQAFRPMADIVEELRDEIVRSIVRGSLLGAVTQETPPETSSVARIVGQTEKVRQILATLLLSSISIVLTTLAVVIGLFTIAPLVGASVVVTAAITGLAVVFVSRVWKRRYERGLRAEERLSDHAGQVLEGLRDVMANAATHRASADVNRSLRANAVALEAAANVGGLRVALLGLTARVPLVVLLVTAPWLLSSGTLTVGALAGAATYLITGLEPALRMLVQQVSNLGLELVTVLKRLARFSVAPELPQGGSLALDRYDLSLSEVTFRYGPHSRPVLDRADARIQYGEHIAIVGPSGIGKSTLASLLSGLETPEAGSVRLGGVELERLRTEWLRETIALVPQQAYVFSGTVRENLTYLAPWSRDADLDRTLTAIGAEDFIESLGGYDGRIEQPDNLTAGQQQMLTLARVFLSPARIVILDEASCHLDSASEDRVERAFARRAGTLIVIAHRISSALQADRVFLIDSSGVHADTHGMLLRDSRTYANLVGHWNVMNQSSNSAQRLTTTW